MHKKKFLIANFKHSDNSDLHLDISNVYSMEKFFIQTVLLVISYTKKFSSF